MDAATASPPVRLLRFGDVIDRVALCKREIENRIAAGEFPQPVRLGPQARRFIEGEIDGYLADVIARSRAAAQTHSNQEKSHG